MNSWGEHTRFNERQSLQCHNLPKSVQVKGDVRPKIELWPPPHFDIVHSSFVHKLSELLRFYDTTSCFKINSPCISNIQQALS